MDELIAAISSAAWLVYLLTFVFLFAEASGVPLPALSFALFAATLAGNGTVSFGAVVLATILGGTAGGPVGHMLGRSRGRPLLDRIGGKVGLSSERLDSTEQQFKGRGRMIVLIRYFVPILPWSAGLFAGIVRMPKGTLFLFNFISITLWALIELTIVAYFSSVVKDWLEKFSLSLLFWLATGLVGTFFLVRMFRRRREARKEHEGAAAAAGGTEPLVAPTTATPAVAPLTTIEPAPTPDSLPPG
jgi:membrane protein DedA with SNARE-associated domain